MTRFIDLMASDVWSEADILARVRAVTEAAVPKIRQAELQMIYLGHITQRRAATEGELAEILQVKQLTEDAATSATQARADMALLASVMALEADPELIADDTPIDVLALFSLRNPAPVVLEVAP